MTLMERIAIKLGIAPKPMFDTALNMAIAKTILVANKLGVFQKLSGHSLSAQEVAKELGGDDRGYSKLLEALVGIGYLRRGNGKYTNAKVAQKWLVEGSRQYMGNLLRHCDDLWALHSRADEAVRANKAVVDFFQYCDEYPEIQRNYTLGQKDLAVASAGEIVSKVRLPANATKLVDLGGAHGYHSIEFCRKYPTLSALVIDFEGAVKLGEEVVKKEKMADRVTFKVGNYITDDIGRGYDVALLFSIIHADAPDTNIATINKVYASLNPGGMIVINEILSYRGKKESLLGLLMALNMLVVTPRGETYAYDEVKGWLESARFVNVSRADLRLPGYSLVLAAKLT